MQKLIIILAKNEIRADNAYMRPKEFNLTICLFHQNMHGYFP